MNHLNPPDEWRILGETLSSWNAEDMEGALSQLARDLEDTKLEVLVNFLESILASELRSDEYASLLEQSGTDLTFRPKGDRRRAWREFFLETKQALTK